jgi:uncharacterized protein YndB with AHSA1/START domain
MSSHSSQAEAAGGGCAGSGRVREGSFHVEQEVLIEAPRARVWAALMDPESWWKHRFDGPPCRLVLEARPGGRFYQAWPGEEGAVFGHVTFLKSPEVIRLSGPLGMTTPVSSVYEWRLEDLGEATMLKLSHRVVGLLDEEYAQNHEQGWRVLWEGLKALAERGERVAPPA